jgi:hypothetical protein
MASGEFTYELSEQLHFVPKHVASRIAWKPGNGEGVFIFQATVLTAKGSIYLDIGRR